MAKDRIRVPALLVITSIFVILMGVIDLIIGLVGALAGTAITIAGAADSSGILVSVGILVIVLSLIGGILQLVMGCSSVGGRHLGFCRTLDIIAIIVSAIVLIMAVVDAATDRSFWIGSIISLAFEVLYLIGIQQAVKRGF